MYGQDRKRFDHNEKKFSYEAVVVDLKKEKKDHGFLPFFHT